MMQTLLSNTIEVGIVVGIVVVSKVEHLKKADFLKKELEPAAPDPCSPGSSPRESCVAEQEAAQMGSVLEGRDFRYRSSLRRFGGWGRYLVAMTFERFGKRVRPPNTLPMPIRNWMVSSPGVLVCDG